jgi:phthalate 4,5-cis-dihydrodiol dehydrogenase
VRARTFDWDARRPTTGAHSVWIEFEGGSVATAVYNGYGRFSTMDLCGDISEWGLRQPAASRPAHRPGPMSAAAEREAKRGRAGGAIPARAPHQPFFGLTLVSCARGDLRQSPDGVLVYDEQGTREMALPADRSPRELVLDEFHAAVTGRRAPLHDGRWGLATLEVCVAATQAASNGVEVRLQEQVAVPVQEVPGPM